MDELQISGKRFISSRRIAREHGYTSDYVGQLIRGGKIVGQKVGRAWYVEEQSFNDYLGADRSTSQIAPVVKEVVKADIPRAIQDTISPTAPVMQTPAVELAIENIVEKKVTETSPAPVHAQTTPVPTAPISENVVSHIPLRIVKSDPTVQNTKDVGGLRYYADDLPSLPRVTTAKHEVSSVASAASQKEGRVEEVFDAAHSRSVSKLFVGGVATLGLGLFILVSVVSSSISLQLSFGANGVAAVSYSIDW